MSLQDITLTGTIDIAKVSLETATVKSTTSQQTVNPSSGKDGFSAITVEAISLQNKTVTPSGSQQQVTADEGYDGLGTVTVGAANDQFNALLNDNVEYVPYEINIVQSGGSCYGFVGANDAGYNLNISVDDIMGGKNPVAYAFYYQKFLKNVVADGWTTIRNNYEFAYSGLKTGHFAKINGFKPTTFAGCVDITDLYFGYNGIVNPTTTDRIFDGKSSGTVNIHVPSDQLTAYQNSSAWTSVIAAEAAAGVTVNIVGDYA